MIIEPTPFRWTPLSVLLTFALAFFGGYSSAVLARAMAYNEMDLPILPPNDPRRNIPEPAQVPQLPGGPEITAPVPEFVFYGQGIEAESVVFVLDFSQSMGEVAERIDYRTTINRWQVCQREFEKAAEGLDSRVRFNVVVFGTSGGCGVQAWRKSLEAATDDNKRASVAWVHRFADVRFMGGATPTAQGVIRAINFGPERIVLLTDGEPSLCGLTAKPDFAGAHLSAVANANHKPIPIDVFGVGMWDMPRSFCQTLACESGGNYYEVR